MTDKSIADLTEITSLGPDDYLVIETAAGTRKIKKSNAALGGRTSPSIVQKATLRGDGTIALPVAPTVGNFMVLMMAGFGASSLPTIYKPAAFSFVSMYQSDANNVVVAATRRVISGDTGSYAMSTSDNQAAVLYEIADAAGIIGLGGGGMSAFFSGSNYTFTGLPSPYGVDDLVFGAFTHDTAARWTLTGEAGLSVDFVTPNDGQNHTSAFFNYDKTFDGTMVGTTTSAPTAPAFGLFTVFGKPN